MRDTCDVIGPKIRIAMCSNSISFGDHSTSSLIKSSTIRVRPPPCEDEDEDDEDEEDEEGGKMYFGRNSRPLSSITREEFLQESSKRVT